VVNREGKIILWSAGAERITGYLRQDLLGRLCEHEFLEHTDSENNALIGNSVPLVETLREGRAITGEVSLRTKSGQFLPVQLQTVPLRDDHGSVQGAVEDFEEMPSAANRERQQSKLAGHGCIDGLTALLNHSMIQAHLRESLNLYLVYPVPFSVLCFSVDGLQQLRERFGKAAADAALRVVAQTLESGLRPTDFFGRWLEEEFLAILTECGDTEAMSVGDRLRKMVHQATIAWWGDKLRVTVSVGATVVRDLDTVGSMVGRAEKGVAESAAAGGNRVVVVAV
jgi:diguanylate cyclase (GGDEF)-like protein/PAS domain S-box-containing protein